jgi:hypothetical protein
MTIMTYLEFIITLFSGLNDFREFSDRRTKQGAVKTFVRLYVLLGEFEEKIRHFVKYFKRFNEGKYPAFDQVEDDLNELYGIVAKLHEIQRNSTKINRAMELYYPMLGTRLNEIYSAAIEAWKMDLEFSYPKPRSSDFDMKARHFVQDIETYLEKTIQARELLRQFITGHFSLDDVFRVI